MGYRFGKGEELTCLTEVSLEGPEGQELCLGHKKSTYWVLAGVYFRDDGYVLQIRGKDSYYPLPEEPLLSELQAEGQLPQPLPPYSIPVIDYVFGYSLWIVIAITAFYYGAKAALAHWRLSKDADSPVTEGPPRLVTETDRFVDEEIAKMKLFGESVQHQAYVMDQAPDMPGAFFAALTDKRLILIKTHVKLFAPLRENHGVEAIPREDLIAVGRSDGSVRVLVVILSERHMSNQLAFLRDVPRLLGVAVEERAAQAA